jgi:hypothetical protein
MRNSSLGYGAARRTGSGIEDPGSTTPPDKLAQVSARASAPGWRYTLAAPVSAFTVPRNAVLTEPTLRFFHITRQVSGKVLEAR